MEGAVKLDGVSDRTETMFDSSLVTKTSPLPES